MSRQQEIGILEAIIKSMETRVQEHETELHKLSDELSQWRKQAHAHCPACGTRSLPPRPLRHSPFHEWPLPDAVLSCLWEYDHPIGVRTLRLRLEEKGYPKAKLGRYGNYLHTVIWRLSEAQKIKRLEGDELEAM